MLKDIIRWTDAVSAIRCGLTLSIIVSTSQEIVLTMYFIVSAKLENVNRNAHWDEAKPPVVIL